MSSFRPMSVSEAGAIIAPKIGLTWTDNRKEVVDFLNRYRNLLFNRYDKHNLFNDVWQCFCPQSFKNLCVTCDPCDRCYQGFSLPRDMASAVQVWEYNQPLRVRSHWREHYTGLAPWHGSRTDVVAVPEHFPTERDLPSASTLKIFAESLADSEKTVIVKVKDADGRTHKLEFTLNGDAWVHTDVAVAEIVSVLLPTDRSGYLTLANADGYELSVYSPSETAPAYKRYKLPGNCHTNILVQGARQYVEVYFDDDMVEVGDRMVLEFMGRYFKYYESKDQRELQVAQLALVDAYKNLDGIVLRDAGGTAPTAYHPRQPSPSSA